MPGGCLKVGTISPVSLAQKSRFSAASPPDVRRGYASPDAVLNFGAVPLVGPLAQNLRAKPEPWAKPNLF